MGPWVAFFLVTAGVSGIVITLVLPMLFKREATLSWGLVKGAYQAMIDQGTENLPQGVTVYGWYTEKRKKGVYLVSYTYATEEDADTGALRGWWWEVILEDRSVHPIWNDQARQRKYALELTEEIKGEVRARGELPSRPSIAPLIKIH